MATAPASRRKARRSIGPKRMRSATRPVASGPIVAAIPNTTQNSEPTCTPLPMPRATKSTRKIMCGVQPIPLRAYIT